jgi:hypothetical protein
MQVFNQNNSINPKRFIVVAIATFFISFSVQAQQSFQDYKFDSTKSYLFKLTDGTSLFGKVLETTSTSVTIQTKSVPKLEIPVGQIKNVEVIQSINIKGGSYWFPNPHATRYYFGPSAISLKKGEGYYQNTYLVLNSVQYGFTNNISVGAGIEFISTFSGDPIMYVTPKVSFKVANNFYAGAGVLLATLPDVDESGRGAAGIAYGIGTYGNSENNVTVGLGYGFIRDQLADQPIVTISGMTRISKKASLVSENWLVPGQSFFSYGVRFFGEKLSVDLALVNSSDIASVLVIGAPFVSVAIKF